MGFCDLDKQVKVSGGTSSGNGNGNGSQPGSPIKYEPLTAAWFMDNAGLIALLISILALLRR